MQKRLSAEHKKNIGLANSEALKKFYSTSEGDEK